METTLISKSPRYFIISCISRSLPIKSFLMSGRDFMYPASVLLLCPLKNPIRNEHTKNHGYLKQYLTIIATIAGFLDVG